VVFAPILKNPTNDQIRAILNAISNLYHEPESIIFEYIQNSIDSALEFRRKSPNEPTRTIFVHLDEQKKQFVIQDDCIGMTSQKVKELPEKVFDSEKKKYPWVVGQFGYGIQSFRSFFENIVISSKNLEENENSSISFDREESGGRLAEEKLVDFGNLYGDRFISKLKRKHGTDVFVQNLLKKEIKGSSFQYISKKLIEKIPLHFEDYIRNGIVKIFVCTWKKRSHSEITRGFVDEIKTINYSDAPGRVFEGKIMNGNLPLADFYFKVVDNKYLNDFKALAEYKPRITRLGTTINNIVDLASFKMYCEENVADISVWARPEVVGRLNVLEKIDIDITRSDLTPSKELDYLYSELVKISDSITDHFKELEKENIESHERQLSEIISDTFTDIAKDLDRFFNRRRKIESKSGDLSSAGVGGVGFIGSLEKGISGDIGGSNNTNSEASPEAENKNVSSDINNNGKSPKEEGDKTSHSKEVKERGIKIEIQPLGENMDPSQLWGESMIVINSKHPYYLERMETGKRRMITKRLISYIAFAATPWYLDLYYKYNGISADSKEKNLMIIKIIADFERLLWSKKQIMQQNVAEVEGDE
jgi:Histidine kinase-, DNA gyrase B-, and HSP90-like ATPase